MPPEEPQVVDVDAGAEHVFVLDLPWIIELEKETGDETIDHVWLAREGGGYREKAERARARDAGSHWEFRFPIGPEGDYRVDVTTAGVTQCVWKGLRLPCEHGPLDEPEPPAAGGPATVVLDVCCFTS